MDAQSSKTESLGLVALYPLCSAVAVEISCIDAWWEKHGDITLVENSYRWFVYIDDCSAFDLNSCSI